jgi:glycosyltransferase involved in cell wall biosynthesis
MAQTFQPDAIVVADDHSIDSTANIVREIAAKNNLVKYISLADNKAGKRMAICAALKQVESEIVIATDADCIVAKHWAETMIGALNEKNRLITGPVVLHRRMGLFNQIQFAELLFLVAGGALVAKFIKAIQVSGANMCFYRHDYQLFVESGHGSKYGSGDDVFFMEFSQFRYGKQSVQFCNNAQAVISTAPTSSVKIWFAQRLRWASKSKGYKSFLPFGIGAFLLIANISFWIAFACLFCENIELWIVWLSLSAKILSEILLLSVFTSKWKQKFNWAGVILLPIFYFFFMVGVAVFSLFSKRKTWKSRTIE